jgi:low affinity Fe/Cu permease
MSTEISLPPEVEARLPPVAPEGESLFLRVADKVSDAMGHPANIAFWLVAVIGWTLVFALSKDLAKGTFLPSWFTSQGYNFPLNLVTTVAELFIGFLVAAATNRVERANDRVMARLEAMEEIVLLEITHNTELTKEVKTLTEQVKANTDLLEEIHHHVTDLETQAAHIPTDQTPPS